MHCRQLTTSHCIPACVLMVETWRGIACDDAAERQKQLFSTLRIAEGYLPTADGAAAMLNAKTSGYAASVDNKAVQTMKARLAGHCAIITCYSGDAGDLMMARGLQSRFGEPHRQPHPHHAMVMRLEGKRLVVLDPWFEAEGQPVPLQPREFVKMWTGYFAIFGR